MLRLNYTGSGECVCVSLSSGWVRGTMMVIVVLTWNCLVLIIKQTRNVPQDGFDERDKLSLNGPLWDQVET